MIQNEYFGIDELGIMGTKGASRSSSECLMSDVLSMESR